jgi:DNA mismatch repair protein MutL
LNSPTKVRILPPVVAERIAAGEVIERPVSVIKELVENSIDAGATEIFVAVEAGGRSLIEVIDNGSGMGAEDLRLCVSRHATSKLSELSDLEKIHTLGFRGEALPSISAVAEMTLISRATGLSEAHQLKPAPLSSEVGRFDSAQPQPVTFGHFLGSDHGTLVRVEGLFSQIPARLKFLKSQASEVAQIREWLEKQAVAHPKVSFRFSSNDRNVLHYKASLTEQGLEERLQKILADGEDFPILTETLEYDGMRLQAHWVRGMSLPQTKKLIQVVNGRVIRDRFLQQAMLSAFRQHLLPGQFPALCLFVDVDPATLDVNVHPSKYEIRFLDNQKIYSGVQALLNRLIERQGTPALSPVQSDWTAPASTLPSWNPPTQSWSTPASQTPRAQPEIWKAAEFQLLASPERKQHLLSQAQFAGTLFLTYLLYEQGDELILVDQHAAHERVRYEQIRSGSRTPQSLLMPETVKIDPEKRLQLEPALTRLGEMGFEVETFGEDSLLFRAIPAEWGNRQVGIRLKNLVEQVLHAEQGAPVADEQLFEQWASEACHSAIRAGDRIEPIEAAALVDQLFECENPWNCPHGRPTVVRIPRGRFEEWFQRREKR